MNVIDKLISAMKLNPDGFDDYDDYDEFYDNDYIEEKPAKRKPVSKNEPEIDMDKSSKTFTKVQQPARPARKSSGGMEVCVIKPVSVEDGREIAETLLTNRAVVLNLEGLDVEIAQRVIDFTSGATFAINGNLQKISKYIFIITPASVDISGDFQDILNGAFDVPALKSDY